MSMSKTSDILLADACNMASDKSHGSVATCGGCSAVALLITESAVKRF